MCCFKEKTSSKNDTERIYSRTEPTIYNSTQGVPYHKPYGWVRWNVAAIDKNDE